MHPSKAIENAPVRMESTQVYGVVCCWLDGMLLDSHMSAAALTKANTTHTWTTSTIAGDRRFGFIGCWVDATVLLERYAAVGSYMRAAAADCAVWATTRTAAQTCIAASHSVMSC